MTMKTAYDPNIEYYMLDYMEMDSISHIRSPYMTLQECYIQISYLLRKGINIKDLRILPEKFLDEKRTAQYDFDKNEYIKDTITNREFFFDGRYESISNTFKKGHVFA